MLAILLKNQLFILREFVQAARQSRRRLWFYGRGVAVLGFAKETKLFEKHGLDVVLVGMGIGSVSLRALIAKDLKIASLSGSGLVQAALQGTASGFVKRLYEK